MENIYVNNIIRLMEKDLQSIIRLSESVGWDYDEKEIKTILLSGKIFGHIDQNGTIISSAAIIPYEENLASLGMVIVNPKYRRRGLASSVVKKCLSVVPKGTKILLISTEKGLSLYRKLGFVKVGYVSKYICEQWRDTNRIINCNKNKVVKMEEKHFSDVCVLDRESFGARRSTYLYNRIKQSEKSFVSLDKEGNINGFGLSILGKENLILGPIIANTYEIATLITERLVNGYLGRVRIDVPSGNEEYMSFVESKGFSIINTPPVMILNSKDLPARNQTLYSISAQAFG
ncbi:GNAT family N-acetyltransferase [Sporosarcina sp. resist]|uniref:GNAT family N-acetyltransferase n=1 Tax=Sporosarcina sp. resist TaxID=2762563 RepID=UPI00164DD10E|nr:GNAT family N-acetyltransferase [Sporosarcina sp. resist]QNK89113.1 GNAT family N-acetyltransferase [Sporosarcina sp. resist]